MDDEKDAKGPVISVFVVSLDDDISSFSNFCRFSACDLVEAENPVVMFGLHASNRRQPPADVDMILGLWPRTFNTLPDLRDNLMDAVSRRLNQGHLVSILLVARSPETIKASAVLEPILSDIAEKRNHYSKLWSVGFFTCGPAHGMETAAKMTAGANAPLRNIFFTSDSAKSDGLDLGERDHAYLRFLIDLARNDDSTKKIFSESRNKPYPKIIWFRSNTISGDIYPNNLLQMLSRFFVQIKNAGIRSNAVKDRKFEEQIEKFLEQIQPNLEDETPHRFEPVTDKIIGSISSSTGFHKSSDRRILDCDVEIRKIFSETYQKSEENVRLQLAIADEQIPELKNFREEFFLPGGGYSMQDKARIDKGTALLAENGSKWADIASQARFKALGHHSDIQYRPDPARNGTFKFDNLEEGEIFNSNIILARSHAKDLPNSRFEYILPAIFPLIMILLTVGAHFVSNEYATFNRQIISSLLLQDTVATYLIIGTLVFPFLVAIFWRQNFLNTARNSIAQLRLAADKIANRLQLVAGNTSSYLTHTRSALLATEGTRKIKLRVQEQPFAALQEQTSNLLPNIGAEEDQISEEKIDTSFIEKNPPEGWMSNQIKSWRNATIDDSAQWLPVFVKSLAVSGVNLDRNAAPTTLKPIQSTFSAGKSKISMVALLPQKPNRRSR